MICGFFFSKFASSIPKKASCFPRQAFSLHILSYKVWFWGKVMFAAKHKLEYKLMLLRIDWNSSISFRQLNSWVEFRLTIFPL